MRAPAGVPPWVGAGFKNFGIYLRPKTLVHPLCRKSAPKVVNGTERVRPSRWTKKSTQIVRRINDIRMRFNFDLI